MSCKLNGWLSMRSRNVVDRASARCSEGHGRSWVQIPSGLRFFLGPTLVSHYFHIDYDHFANIAARRSTSRSLRDTNRDT